MTSGGGFWELDFGGLEVQGKPNVTNYLRMNDIFYRSNKVQNKNKISKNKITKIKKTKLQKQQQFYKGKNNFTWAKKLHF